MENENTPLTLEGPPESPVEIGVSAATAPPPDATARKAGPETASNIRIGDRLLAMGVITQGQVDVALREKSRAPDKMVGRILLEFGF